MYEVLSLKFRGLTVDIFARRLDTSYQPNRDRRHTPMMAEKSVERPLDIAIVGGGITGIVCAVALAKKGVHARIFEAKVIC